MREAVVVGFVVRHGAELDPVLVAHPSAPFRQLGAAPGTRVAEPGGRVGDRKLFVSLKNRSPAGAAGTGFHPCSGFS